METQEVMMMMTSSEGWMVLKHKDRHESAHKILATGNPGWLRAGVTTR